MLSVQCGSQAASAPSTQARRAMQQGGLHSRTAGSARSSALTAAERTSSVDRPADPWTEVVHKESGQIYYWNEDTSEGFSLCSL